MAEVARREHPGFAYEVADLRKLPFAGRLPVDALKLGGDRRGFDRLVAWKPAAGLVTQYWLPPTGPVR
jgi:hypothetical protein